VQIKHARLHAGRKGTTILVRLGAPAAVVLLVRGPSPSCSLAGRRVVHLPAGTSRVRFLGRFHGRALRPGTYGITVMARRGGHATRLARLAVEIVAPGKPIRHSRTQPVFDGCGAGSTAAPAPGFPFASLGLATPASVRELVDAAAHDDPLQSFRPPSLRVRVPALPKLRTLSPANLAGSSGGGGLVLFALLALVVATMGVLVVRFLRETSNP
jgi:hypothetical protein